MTWNKKAIMTKFLVSLVLALVLFVPACYAVSKLFFRLSDQAEENFDILTQKLQEFSDAGEAQKSFTLIMDGKTGIFLFNSTQNSYANTEQASYGDEMQANTLISRNFLPYPSGCSSAPCICLCREFTSLGKPPIKSDTDYGLGYVVTSYDTEIGCSTISCHQISGNFASWSTYREEAASRRVIVNFIKENETVKIQ